MIQALIIDDEPGNREFLIGLIADYCPEIKILGEAHDLTSGVEAIKEHRPDLVFLDIQMPGGSGFDLLDQMSTTSLHFEVIFTTAFDQYAIQAFRYSALDYLLKPIHPLQLTEAISKVRIRKEKAEQLERLKNFRDIMDGKQEKISHIILTSANGQQRAEISDIIRCEADRNYTRIYMKNDKRIVATRSLKEFDELLTPFGFLRIHQSHLINLKMFQTYHRPKDSGGGMVELSDGSRLEVSRGKKKILLEAIR